TVAGRVGDHAVGEGQAAGDDRDKAVLPGVVTVEHGGIPELLDGRAGGGPVASRAVAEVDRDAAARAAESGEGVGVGARGRSDHDQAVAHAVAGGGHNQCADFHQVTGASGDVEGSAAGGRGDDQR